MYFREFDIKIKSSIGVSPVGGDTLLLAKVAAKMNGNSVLDVGTGTGFIPIYLSTLGRKCTGSDINKFAIECAKKNARINKINCKFIHSDLFNSINEKFDIIIFNPPFGNTTNQRNVKFLEIIKSLVPKDNDLLIRLSYILIRRSRQKLIERFLKEVKNYINKNGQILILLYPPELKLFKGFRYKKKGEYKDFSLIAFGV